MPVSGHSGSILANTAVLFMTDTDNDNLPSPPPTPPDADEVTPSWKPLGWALGILGLAAILGEFALELTLDLLELIFDLLENIYLVVVEAPEEILEDYIEQWLEEHYPQDASRYSEMVTAIGLTPVKLLVGLVLLRALWKYGKEHGLPRLGRWLKRHYLSVRLAFSLLAWPYKIVAALVVLGILVVLI
jgi:hypothetical protein